MAKSSNETIYDLICVLILTGQFIPGCKFKISELTSRFDVSLNVVREALDRL